jgi:hypothetical protein
METKMATATILTNPVQPRPRASGIAGPQAATRVPATALGGPVASMLITALLVMAGLGLVMLLAFVSSRAIVQKFSSPDSSEAQADAAAARKEQQRTKALERSVRQP